MANTDRHSFVLFLARTTAKGEPRERWFGKPSTHRPYPRSVASVNSSLLRRKPLALIGRIGNRFDGDVSRASSVFRCAFYRSSFGRWSTIVLECPLALTGAAALVLAEFRVILSNQFPAFRSADSVGFRAVVLQKFRCSVCASYSHRFSTALFLVGGFILSISRVTGPMFREGLGWLSLAIGVIVRRPGLFSGGNPNSFRVFENEYLSLATLEPPFLVFEKRFTLFYLVIEFVI